MPLLGELLNNLATKAGIKPENEDFKNFIIADALQKLEVPEQVATLITNNLISLQDAVNNHPKIKTVYHSQILDRLDKNIMERAPEYGLTPEMVEEIKAETNTYKKQELFEKRIKEVTEKRLSGDQKGQVVELQKQVDKLQNDLRLKADEVTNVQKDFERKHTEIRTDYDLRALFNEYDTTLADLPANVRNLSLKNLVFADLQKRGAVLSYDDNGSLVIKSKDGNNYYAEDNQQKTPKDIIAAVFAANNILKPSAPAPSTPAGGNTSGQNPRNGSGGNSTDVNNSLKGLLDGARVAFQPAAK